MKQKRRLYYFFFFFFFFFFFASQSNIDESSISLPSEYHRTHEFTLDFIQVFPDEVLNILKDLNMGKASGPDGIHDRILREGAHQLAKPPCDLFNASLSLCFLPSSWKLSNVCPIFKSGGPFIPSDYRPVSLLNTAEKVFDRIFYDHVFSCLRGTIFFTPFQSGFYRATPRLINTDSLSQHL